MVGESAVLARKQPVGRCWEWCERQGAAGGAWRGRRGAVRDHRWRLGGVTRAQAGDSLVGISPEAWSTFRLMSCPCVWREAEG